MTTRPPLTQEQIDARNARRRAQRAANKNSSLSPEFAAKMNAAGEGALEVIARPHNKNMHRSPVVETSPVVEPVADYQPRPASTITGQLTSAELKPLVVEAPTTKTFKYARPSMPELIAAVRAYAAAHAKRGGWDFFTGDVPDKEFIAVIDKATSVNGAIINARNAVKPRADLRKEVQSA